MTKKKRSTAYMDGRLPISSKTNPLGMKRGNGPKRCDCPPGTLGASTEGHATRCPCDCHFAWKMIRG